MTDASAAVNLPIVQAADLSGVRTDLQMLVGLAGKERTAGEFRASYGAAGLRLRRIILTASMFSFIEGIPRAVERKADHDHFV